MRRGVRAGWLLAVAIVLGCAGYYYLTLYRPVTFSAPVTVEIRPHATFSYVATHLQQRGIIPSALTFKIYARLTHQTAKLKTGEYTLSGRLRPIDILTLLTSGNVKPYWLVVPEGKWAVEIQHLIALQWPDAAGPFMTEVARPAAWRDKVPMPLAGTTLEGYLFPDTYKLGKSTTATQIVQAMLHRFRDTCYAEYRAHPPADGRSLHEVLTLASLVEAEAKAPSERPLIAGVLLGRLRKHMMLQCDATILYAHGERLSRVWDKDLTIDSPYNTYRHLGLPPGPICNPGLDAFRAALHPTETDYLYYRARGDGTHIFTHTLAEHDAAKRLVGGKK